MVTLLVIGILILIAMLFIAGVLAWLLLRLYLLRLCISYGAGNIRLSLEFGSVSNRLLSAAVYNEAKEWHVQMGTRKPPLKEQSWRLPEDLHWRRIWRRLRIWWKHPQRSAWIEAYCQLIKEIYEQLRVEQWALNVRMGFPYHPHTGYLAAAAYPLNFTIFRALGVFQPRVIPDFSTPGISIENCVRCTIRGYQLLKPGYRFLRRPVVQKVLKKRVSNRLRFRTAKRGQGAGIRDQGPRVRGQGAGASN